MNPWWILSLLLLMLCGVLGVLVLRVEQLSDEVRGQYQKPSRGPAR